MSAQLSKSGLTRRELLKWTGMSAAGVLLAACAPSVAPAATSGEADAAAPPSGEAATIAYWFLGGERWDKFYNENIFPVFYESHPEIKIESTVLGSWDDLYNKLVTSAAGGAPPEVVRQKDFFTPDFATRGILQEIDEYVAASDHINEDAYLALPWQNTFWNGSQVALPLHIFIHYTHMNNQLFEQAGLVDADGKPQAPQNWEEYKQTTSAISALGDGIWGTMLRNYSGTEDTVNYFHAWLTMAGGKLINDTYDGFLFNSEEGLDALTFLVDLIKEGSLLPPGTSTEGVIENNKIGMWLHAALYWPDYLVNNPDFQWSTAVNPERQTRGAVVRANHHVIFKAAREKDAAWQFLDFHHQPDIDYLYAQNANYITARKDTQQMPMYEGPYEGREGVLFTTEFAQLAEAGNVPQPIFPGYQESTFVIGAQLMEAFLLQKSPEEALAQAETEANEVLASTTQRLLGN
jgi:multiple sugar transport system substrate-binding protein